MAGNWFDSATDIRDFGQALANSGVLESSDDFAAFLARPRAYDDTFDAWQSCESPIDETNDGWDDFLTILEEETEDEDDDEDDE